MTFSHRVLALALAIFLMPLAARAQENLPHIGYVYPAGGRQGITFEVTLGGQFLDEISRVYVTGSGVEARVADKGKPMTENDAGRLRSRVTQLQRGKPDLADRKELAQIQRKLVRYMAAQMRRQTQPAISETVTLEITIRGDAAPGRREMRVDAARGVSNPIWFFVGTLPEFREREPELDLEPHAWNTPDHFPLRPTTDITLPAVANGQIVPREADYIRWEPDRFTPGDADRFRFQARKGQRLVVSAAARDLVPYLADAVPGWFQATLSLCDAKGREIAFDDDYRFHPDPVLLFAVPEDGQYTIEIKDAIYRGRPDFVYRLSIGELPFISGIFPLGGRAGEQTAVELSGWNLSGVKPLIDARDKAPGVHPITVRKGEMTSNAVPFAVDTLPECFEKEPNDSIEKAQPVTLPVIVNGRIGRPGDWDVFRFAGKAGQRVVAEVNARRLDSPLDSVLELTDASGKRLAFNDDFDDKADALNTHHADSLINTALPADGTYFLRLGDAQHRGGPEYAYRLRISPPRPDFALRVAPSCIHAVSWRLTPVTIYALRKDGFSGEIALQLKDAPEGVSISGGVVPAGQDRVRVTLAVPPWLPGEPISLHLEGKATVDGEEVVRSAVAADDMMQAFFYRHLVPADDLKLVMAERSRFRTADGKAKPVNMPPKMERRYLQPPAALLSGSPAKVPAGGTAELRVRIWAADKGEITIELSDPPEGVTVDRVSRIDKGLAIVLRADAAKAKPGLRGNLIAVGYQQRTETNKEGKTREYLGSLGTLPAIPFEITAP